ncbi:hypothetical protein [Pedosphaera parvula]|uniref:Uncharacterized protein n=1 Tax=Pedosphaera parvula (strain Ellin514) TaxID=320771 RepID=B9XQE4_PEDPL|nr:hypothetical protein [Pedosphaera parvula]EEF57968.1 hypothetical protein Cflav_PD1143 [Pedosphaera parvula Ellin514]
MSRTRKVLFLLLATIAMAILIIIVRSKSASQPLPTQTGQLSNGTTISLKKITYGTKHQCFLNKPNLFQQFVRALPIRYQKKVGFGNPGFQFESSTGFDTLGIWMSTPVPVPRMRLLTIASTGHETTQLNFMTAIVGQSLSSWEIVDFPRREKEFTLRLEEYLTNNVWKPVVEWHITNPGPTTHPVWNPPPLPISHQAAGLAFSLTNLTTYIGTNGPGVKAIFLVTSNSLPVTGWVIKNVHITDATGNQLWQNRTDIFSGDGKIIYDCGTRLDPRETAYKLHVDFESYDDHPMNHPPGAPAFIPTKLTLDFIAKPTAASTP